MKVLKSVELLKKTYGRLLGEVAKENDITLNELKILMFLNNNCEDNIAKSIVEGLGTTKSHVSMSLCDLEKKGYVKKIQDEQDKKKLHIELTEKSFEIIERGKKVQKKVQEIMLKGISEEEQKQLSNILKKMQENLETFNKN